jgi:uncharacterized PurR-regulated membrane protein YhhQ (DUF165 family)
MFSRPLVIAVALAGLLDLAANILAAKIMMPLPFGLLAPGGTLLFTLGFVTYDFLRRTGGIKPTVTAVGLGFGASVVYSLAFGGGAKAVSSRPGTRPICRSPAA